MITSLIPHSQATTSWELCEDLIWTINQEPKRFTWGDWIKDLNDVSPRLQDMMPSCGTQGCVHGWLALITMTYDFDSMRVEHAVNKLFDQWDLALQGDLNDLAYARGPFQEGQQAENYPLYVETWLKQQHDPGEVWVPALLEDWLETNLGINQEKWETQRMYADRAIRAIRKFMERNETPLKVFKITIPPRPGAPVIPRPTATTTATT